MNPLLSTPRIALRTFLETDLPEFEAEIRVRQVVGLAKQTPIHAIGNLGNGALLAGVFWSRLPHAAIAGWLGLFALFTGFELVRWWRKRRWPIPKQASRRAIRATTGWALFAGAMWMAAVIFAFPRDSMQLQLLILFLVGGLGAGAVGSMAAQPIACFSFVAPPLITVLALLAIQTNSEVAHVIAAMGVLYLAVLMAALASSFSSFVTIVRGKFDSRALETKLLQMELAASTEANRAKSLFLANMSHELRTPLNAVIGFSEIIHDQPVGTVVTEQYRDYAKDIHSAGQHLLRIVNDVLDISKIEAGRSELHQDRMEIAHVARRALKLVEAAASNAGVTITADLPPDLPDLIADEIRVKQILINLLSNAVKFSKTPGLAVLGAAPRPDGGLALWVRDNGIGMTEREIALARQPFRQVQNSFARQHEGAGLGLSLVEGFIALHGGRMEIDSKPGEGTTVSLVFPPERVVWPQAGRAASTAAA